MQIRKNTLAFFVGRTFFLEYTDVDDHDDGNQDDENHDGDGNRDTCNSGSAKRTHKQYF